MRRESLHEEEQDQGRQPDPERDERGFRQVLREAQEVAEEAVLGDVEAEEFRDLVADDDEPDPGLEAGQDRRGDEVRDEPQPQDRGGDQEQSGQRGQRRGRGDQPAGVAVGYGEGEFGRDQNREGRRRADAQHARGSEQRIDGHRDEGGIEPDADRQAGDGGVGHGLGEHDGCRRDASNDIGAPRRARRDWIELLRHLANLTV